MQRKRHGLVLYHSFYEKQAKFVTPFPISILNLKFKDNNYKGILEGTIQSLIVYEYEILLY